jgi:ribosomal protein L34E
MSWETQPPCGKRGRTIISAAETAMIEVQRSENEPRQSYGGALRDYVTKTLFIQRFRAMVRAIA